MKKEYIMSVQVDNEGHEYGLSRERELVRCGTCRYHVLIKEMKDKCRVLNVEIPTNEFYCMFGETEQKDLKTHDSTL